MSEVASFSVQIVDNITNYGVTTLEVWLYVYPATVNFAGVVTGTKAKTLSDADIKAVHGGGGVYQFNDVPTGSYTIIVGSSNIKTRVLEGYERYLHVDISGRDIRTVAENGKGLVVKDKTTGTLYRITVDNGQVIAEGV